MRRELSHKTGTKNAFLTNDFIGAGVEMGVCYSQLVSFFMGGSFDDPERFYPVINSFLSFHE
jgi:hypothetical protein